MNHDRILIDTIKSNFARKSAAQLRAIVQVDDRERWSPEAFEAAGEVLQDRLSGLAQEPDAAEEETPPADAARSLSAGLIVMGAMFGLAGLAIISSYKRSDYSGDGPDTPVPFGSHMAWLALETTDAEAVAAALGLRGVREVTWAEGIDAACRSSVFITPPLGDWTLAASASLFPPNQPETVIKPLLERLSLQFGDAQYFCTHSGAGLHVWARAIRGSLARGYCWLGQRGITLWDEGVPTQEECDIGLRPSVVQEEGTEVIAPDEEGVLQLAAYWSVDPMTLDGSFKEPVMGLLGNAWAAADPLSEP